MRARRLTAGGKPAPVEVPFGVSLRSDLTVRCACGALQDLSALDRALAERQLGEFCRRHRGHEPRVEGRRSWADDLNAIGRDSDRSSEERIRARRAATGES